MLVVKVSGHAASVLGLIEKLATLAGKHLTIGEIAALGTISRDKLT